MILHSVLLGGSIEGQWNWQRVIWVVGVSLSLGGRTSFSSVGSYSFCEVKVQENVIVQAPLRQADEQLLPFVCLFARSF